MPELVTLVTRIRCKLAQVATAGFPENFLCTQGGNAYIRKPTSGGGVSTYPTPQPPRSASPYPHRTASEPYSPNVVEWAFCEVRGSKVNAGDALTGIGVGLCGFLMYARRRRARHSLHKNRAEEAIREGTGVKEPRSPLALTRALPLCGAGRV